MAQPTNHDVADGLERVAELLELDAQADGKREALRRAALAIRHSERPIADRVERDGVEGVHALGLSYELAGVVTDWVRSGRFVWLECLERRLRSRHQVSQLPGIGPRLACELKEVLGVDDLNGLAEAAYDGRLANVCGFGPRRVSLVVNALGRRRLVPGPRRASRTRPGRAAPQQLDLLSH